MTSSVAWFDHVDCDLHELRIGETERDRSQRTKFVRKIVQATPDIWRELFQGKPIAVTLRELELVHSDDHLARLEALREFHQDLSLGPDAEMVNAAQSLKSIEAAAACVKGAVQCVFSEAGPRRAFCLVRPPGHHADAKTAKGYCFLNNVAIAAALAKATHGAQRVGILDWDLHHGDGTQAIFQNDPSVMYVSLHRGATTPKGDGEFYPETGHVHQGSNVRNFPLPHKCSSKRYMRTFRKALGELEAFAPDLVLISAGFDAHHDDSYHELGVTYRDFYDMTVALAGLAERIGHGRVVSVLEGGYDKRVLARCVVWHLAALLSKQEPTTTRLRKKPL